VARDARARASVTGVAGDGPTRRATLRAVSRLRVIAVTLLWSVIASGCATVKPHERENLARRSMTEDRAPGDLRFQQHQSGAREGADGGTGEPGGGCGCN
jgi:hypothetical protein